MTPLSAPPSSRQTRILSTAEVLQSLSAPAPGSGSDSERADAPRVFVDLRDGQAWSKGSIPGARHVPASVGMAQILREIDQRTADLPSGRAQAKICLVCQRGRIASQLAEELSEQLAQRSEAMEVEVLESGIEGFLAAGGSLETPAHEAYEWNWKAIRAQFPIVQRQVPLLGGASAPLLYLDHAASTHPPIRVSDALYRFVCRDYSNIHRGTHLLSRQATARFDDCYSAVARFIRGDIERNTVIFSNNTTHAIDICAYAMSQSPGYTLVTGLEHHSNDLPHRRRGPVRHCPITATGELDMAALESILKDGECKLVAVTGGSNVTGWMPDLDRIAELAHAHGAKILVDAAQRIAHQRLDVHDNEDPRHLDFVVGAGHKSYAPFGAGFLFAPRDLMDRIPPYLPGGGTASGVGIDAVDFVQSPDRHQGGTPNIGGVLTLAEALCFLDEIGMERVREHEKVLMRRAFSALQAMPEVTIYGPQDPDARLAVFSFNIQGVSDLKAAAILSEEHGIACRNGRFCAHMHMDALLEEQRGYTVEDGGSPGAVRASFGLFNTLEDVERLIAGIDSLRKGQWKGDYRMGETEERKDMLGRCNDRWMQVQDES